MYLNSDIIYFCYGLNCNTCGCNSNPHDDHFVWVKHQWHGLTSEYNKRKRHRFH